MDWKEEMRVKKFRAGGQARTIIDLRHHTTNNLVPAGTIVTLRELRGGIDDDPWWCVEDAWACQGLYEKWMEPL